MDNDKLQQTLRKLNWEARHWKRTRGRQTENAFLTDIDHLDPDFAKALMDRGIETGALLDIGTGSGNQAIQFATLGFDVTATDIARIGVVDAIENAIATGVAIRFLEDDITRTALTETFDVIADRGCYTLLPEETLPAYVTSVARLMRPDSFLLLKVDRKKKGRVDQLLERLTLVETWESTYPLESEPLKASFFVLRINHP
ncbi:MAG: class I SAM-dependent methyltransferase [Geobacteraceae bacterium]|nr:class I SAM-dependent methyltransferase [Geobacteraceae bacterium]